MSDEIIFLSILWGLFVAIFWMVVGWRAMRAHEKIAGEIRRYVGESSDGVVEGGVETEPYECPKCNMISRVTTANGNCPHCGAKI